MDWVQSHWLVMQHWHLLFLILLVLQTRTQTTPGRKQSFLGCTSRPFAPLWWGGGYKPHPFPCYFLLFWIPVHTPRQASWCSPKMSAEVWCLHYVWLGKFLVLWQSAENTHYKSKAYGKFRNKRNLLQTWGAESSFFNPFRKQNKTKQHCGLKNPIFCLSGMCRYHLFAT